MSLQMSDNDCKRVGLDVPSIEVRHKNMTIGVDVQIGSRALATYKMSLRFIPITHSHTNLLINQINV